jgi:glycosyltransferase involved in cell wall biosynthesis
VRQQDRKPTKRSDGHKLLQVAINAQLQGNGHAGGIEQAVAGLIYGLGCLPDGQEEYTVVCASGERAWVERHMGRNQHLVERSSPIVDRSTIGIARLPMLQPAIPLARNLWRRSVMQVRGRQQRKSSAKAPQFSLQPTAVFDRIKADVVHFPYQSMQRVTVPTIFYPHDFQHEHYPEFFTPKTLERRRRFYPEACRAATAVVAGSPSVRDDICRYTGVPSEKVFLMPWGNPLELAGPRPSENLIGSVTRRLRLPAEFAFYPAQTWPHKNHIRLLQALAMLRDNSGVTVKLVCTGRQNEHFPEVWKEALRLSLEDHVQFLGYVDSNDLRAIYQLASFVVFPSLFEGWGFPPIEALGEGVPLGCSRIQPLIDCVGDAALLFDPESVESIAEAISKLALDPGLRAVLRRRSAEHAKHYTWEACARSHRSLYRLLGGSRLTDEDYSLLTAAQPKLQLLPDCSSPAPG